MEANRSWQGPLHETFLARMQEAIYGENNIEITGQQSRESIINADQSRLLAALASWFS